MTHLELSTFLVGEGLLLGALCAARSVCARRCSLESLPAAVRPRVELGNRLAPVVLVVAAALVVIGGVVRLLG